MKIHASKFYAAASVQGRTVIGPFDTVGEAQKSATANKLHVFAGAELSNSEINSETTNAAGGKGANPNFAAQAAKGGKGGGKGAPRAPAKKKLDYSNMSTSELKEVLEEMVSELMDETKILVRFLNSDKTGRNNALPAIREMKSLIEAMLPVATELPTS